MRGGFIIRRIVYVVILICMGPILWAQKVPSKPLSNPVYTPIILNPAFAGSKDYTQISLTTKVLKTPDSQLLNFHQRLNSPNGSFSKFGFGGYAFREQLEKSCNTGISLAGSYHISLDRANVHLLSVGAALKGFMNLPGKAEETGGDTLDNVFNPNMDFGLYYYGPTAFAGISATNLMGTKLTDGVNEDSESYIPREYHFYGGYKFVLSKKSAVVLEPSLLVSVSDSTISEPHKHMVPYLKLYLQNFYIGSYFKSLDQIALFFQYQFPRLFTGVFLEFPRVGFLNDENIIFEFCLGVNLGQGGHTFLQNRHW
jgi:type IX secretion system PorP/SprF family membrane protein